MSLLKNANHPCVKFLKSIISANTTYENVNNDQCPEPEMPTLAKGQQFVISVSLYGNKPRYINNMFRNIKLRDINFPGWNIWIYHSQLPEYRIQQVNTRLFNMYNSDVLSHTTSSIIIYKLNNTEYNLILVACFYYIVFIIVLSFLFIQEVMIKLSQEKGVKLIDMTNSTLAPMLWRFLTVDSEEVTVFISRDADSQLSSRDACAVRAWIKNQAPFNCIRDHIAHSKLVYNMYYI